jgi:lysophospholipase L1-like esterase
MTRKGAPEKVMRTKHSRGRGDTILRDYIFVRRATKPLAVAALFASFALPLPAHAGQTSPRCNAPLDLIRLANPLPHFAYKLAAGQAITIVAIGSSSTAGAGASSPSATYPSRLAAELKQRFPDHPITVINRGVGGEEIGDMLKRFDKAVVANKPDLVLWQLGTNSVIRNHPLNDHGALIRAGLRKIRAIGADVVLIDPQFTPKVIAKPEAGRMVELIAVTAKQEDVDLFRRYGVMKRWREIDHLGFDTFSAPDGLHMNDWSYACMAKGLGAAIAEAVQRPVMSARAAQHLVP